MICDLNPMWRVGNWEDESTGIRSEPPLPSPNVMFYDLLQTPKGSLLCFCYIPRVEFSF